MDAARAIKRNLEEAEARAKQYRKDKNIDDERVALSAANAYRESLTFVELERDAQAAKLRS